MVGSHDLAGHQVQAHGAAVTFPHCGTVPHPLLCTSMRLRARWTHRPDEYSAAVVKARMI